MNSPTRFFAAVCAICLMVGCGSSRAQRGAPPGFTIEQAVNHQKSFDEVWTTINNTYFNPSRLNSDDGVDWEGARKELQVELANANTTPQVRAVLEKLIARLGESHFAILPADLYIEASSDPTPSDQKSSDQKSESDSTQPTTSDKTGSVGLTVARDAKGVFVARVTPGSPADIAGVKAGWGVESIEGEPVAGVLKRWDANPQASAEASAILMMTIEQRLEAPAGEVVTVRFRDADNRKKDLDLVAAEPPGKLAKFGNLPPMRVTIDQRTLDGNIGYFRLSIFFEPSMVIPAFEQFIKQHADASGIIIDLRGNLGGLGIMAPSMAGYLVESPNLLLGTMTTRENTIKFVLNPRLTRFDGPVAVLVDGRSMSTSEIMAGGLKDIGRARIFGSTTPGAALPSNIAKLPNGDRFQYAFADYVSAGGKRLEGTGVVPDEIVDLDRASLLRGSDPVIDAARRWIASGPRISAPSTQPSRIPSR